MNIEDFVKNNKTYDFFNKGAIKKTQALIEENEELLYALVTNVSINKNNHTSFENQNQIFGGALQIKNVLSGVIAITDKRIIFCNSTLGTVNEKQILVNDIQSIDEHISGFTKTGELRVNGITETFIIKIFKSELGEELKKAINKARNIKEKTENNITVMSNAEIRKYKGLLDDGIITQEEFEIKKQQLLKQKG